MRQAGRYLPEYRALRETRGGFLDLAMDPDAATEITLQPIRRFGMDGAILFSDILIVPWALGQDLRFEADLTVHADLAVFTRVICGIDSLRRARLAGAIGFAGNTALPAGGVHWPEVHGPTQHGPPGVTGAPN